MSEHSDAKPDLHGGLVHIPRSRGALSGVLLIVFGAWAGIIPFLGPLFSYAYTPKQAWAWTAARGWLEVLPGAVSLVAGIIVLVSANRVTASVAAWLAVASGIWLVVGRDVAGWLHIGSPGQPASSSPFLAALESLGLFSGIGALIVLVGALALGRLSIRSVRDVRVAQRHERKTEGQRRKLTDSAYRAGRRDEAAAHNSGASEPGTEDHPPQHRNAVTALLHREHRTQPADRDTSGATAADDHRNP